MKYTEEQFKADVIAECKAIKDHATENERLRIWSIDAQDPEECIYGRMTGNCRSSRAKELINLCCIKTVENCGFNPAYGFESAIRKITPSKVTIDGEYFHIEYLSALEAYIMLPVANISAIQDYLTGHTETLTL
jgi:hypothetical protein